MSEPIKKLQVAKAISRYVESPEEFMKTINIKLTKSVDKKPKTNKKDENKKEEKTKKIEKPIDEAYPKEKTFDEKPNNNGFKYINSIDEKTAILLNDNGFRSIEDFRNISLADLKKITGIKKKDAKKIFEEIQEKLVNK